MPVVMILLFGGSGRASVSESPACRQGDSGSTQAIPCSIYRGQSDNGTGVSRAIIISPLFHVHLYIRVAFIRRITW
jgi:hypothetical protein